MVNTEYDSPELIRPVFDAFHQQYIRSYDDLEMQLIHLTDQGALRAFEMQIVLEILTSPFANDIDLKRVNHWIGPHLKVEI